MEVLWFYKEVSRHKQIIGQSHVSKFCTTSFCNRISIFVKEEPLNSLFQGYKSWNVPFKFDESMFEGTSWHRNEFNIKKKFNVIINTTPCIIIFGMS